MKFVIETPTRAYVTEYTEEDLAMLRKLLTYTNTAAAHLVKRHFNNKYWRQKNNATWSAHLEVIKLDVVKTLVYVDDKGPYVRPGSLSYLGTSISNPSNTENKIVYPKIKKIPWAKPLQFEPYPYQLESCDKLIDVKHGNVELTTGSGKSLVMLKIARETVMKCAIIAPSKSIFHELLEKFDHHFGKGKIGRFGDGKKVLGKQITICIGDSLVNVKKETPEWEFFSKLDGVIIDESHSVGAETLEEVCHGLFANVPYRLFLSATQTRGDGSEKLLQSIIGPTVHTLSTAEAVAGGYICPHEFRIIELESSNPNIMVSDPLEMKRIHFLENKNIAAFIAKLAKAEATTYRRQTLVLVQELNQIAMLLPKLLADGIPTAIAHSETRSDRLKLLGIPKANSAESVEAFNKGEAMVIIGSSCIAVGVNLFPVANCVNWVGGRSEIKTKQGAVGRAVRKQSSSPYQNPNAEKTKAIIWDFDVSDIHLLSDHLADRIEFYGESGSTIKTIKIRS